MKHYASTVALFALVVFLYNCNQDKGAARLKKDNTAAMDENQTSEPTTIEDSVKIFGQFVGALMLKFNANEPQLLIAEDDWINVRAISEPDSVGVMVFIPQRLNIDGKIHDFGSLVDWWTLTEGGWHERDYFGFRVAVQCREMFSRDSVMIDVYTLPEEKKEYEEVKSFEQAAKIVHIADRNRLVNIAPEVCALHAADLIAAFKPLVQKEERGKYRTVSTEEPLGQSIELPYERPIVLKKMVILSKPPFFQGTTPFLVITGTEPSASSYQSMGDVYFWVFGDWQVIFSKEKTGVRGIPQWAVAMDCDDHILAQARLLGEEDETFTVLEVHYSHPYPDLTASWTGGLSDYPVFRCKSQYDLIGFKIREYESAGVKSREFFFMWPR